MITKTDHGHSFEMVKPYTEVGAGDGSMSCYKKFDHYDAVVEYKGIS